MLLWIFSFAIVLKNLRQPKNGWSKNWARIWNHPRKAHCGRTNLARRWIYLYPVEATDISLSRRSYDACYVKEFRPFRQLKIEMIVPPPASLSTVLGTESSRKAFHHQRNERRWQKEENTHGRIKNNHQFVFQRWWTAVWHPGGNLARQMTAVHWSLCGAAIVVLFACIIMCRVQNSPLIRCHPLLPLFTSKIPPNFTINFQVNFSAMTLWVLVAF